ncbi:hypothetical protein ZOSMA_164G00150 [Zostera marina]|uniref:Uncharacterized protein n=1 Tax=Zostera marina TaxID=29655 RepID=A0A0K9PTQ1_ZOSMR|nr:hypothetical protein ZOSMA_164G00150 [Zostera marina]
MARSARGRRHLSSLLRSTPYSLASHKHCQEKDGKSKRQSKSNGIKKDWEDATCSVCMEFPHNAVLLLCSSHDKGCRPYMCGTSHRYSNCLDQFKKAYMKVEKYNAESDEKSETTELVCPLCRGEVKGWTVVEPARKYLNATRRSCMQDGCSFAGTYKDLRKHVKAEHPSAKPRQVDPVLEQKWRMLEHERDREDVISTIRSSMPGATVFGDYVIDNNGSDDTDEEEIFNVTTDGHGGRVRVDDDNLFDFLFLLQAFGNSGNADIASRLRRSQRGYRVPDASSIAQESQNIDGNEDGDGLAIRQETNRRRRRRRRTG